METLYCTKFFSHAVAFVMSRLTGHPYLTLPSMIRFRTWMAPGPPLYFPHLHSHESVDSIHKEETWGLMTQVVQNWPLPIVIDTSINHGKLCHLKFSIRGSTFLSTPLLIFASLQIPITSLSRENVAGSQLSFKSYEKTNMNQGI